MLLRFDCFLSYPGNDQNSPGIELFPVLPGEIAPHYYEFKVTSVPSQLPDVFSVSEVLRTHKHEHLGLNSGGFKLRLSLELRQ